MTKLFRFEAYLLDFDVAFESTQDLVQYFENSTVELLIRNPSVTTIRYSDDHDLNTNPHPNFQAYFPETNSTLNSADLRMEIKDLREKLVTKEFEVVNLEGKVRLLENRIGKYIRIMELLNLIENENGQNN